MLRTVKKHALGPQELSSGGSVYDIDDNKYMITMTILNRLKPREYVEFRNLAGLLLLMMAL
ncbi:MAG: hypothetical protein SOY49_01775, partial [Prevotella sp.]|nr:hypothetical protein [Prevotella sp.]